MNKISLAELQTIPKEGFNRRVKAASKRIYNEIINTAKQGKTRYTIRLDVSDNDIIHAVFYDLSQHFRDITTLFYFKTEITASWMSEYEL